MRTIELEGGIKLQYGPISVDKVEPHQFKDNVWQAQLRQEVTSIYPAARAHNSLSDGLFEAGDFGDGQSYVEKRVTWVPVKVGTTLEQVQELIRQNSDAVLHKTLSMDPILSEEQINAIETGLSEMTYDDYREKFVRDSENNPVLYGNKNFYRSINFKKTFVADTDKRSAELDAAGPVTMTPAAPATVQATAENAEATI